MQSATATRTPGHLAWALRHAAAGRAFGQRLSTRHVLLVDGLQAAALLTFGVVGDVFGPDSGPYAWVADVALVAPLVVRRRWPFPVFLVISAVALVQWALDVRAGADLAVLVALYSVAAHQPRRRLVVVAALITEVGVLLAAVRWAPPGQTWTAALLLTGTATAAWVGGIYVRTRRAYLAAVLERAETAERDREQQSQLAVAQERTRIAREMHDVVAHSLSVMIALNDGAAATARTAPQETELALRQASVVGRESLQEMRRLLGVLRAGEAPELAPQPGHHALDDLVSQVRAAGLPVEVEVSGRPLQPSAGAQLAVHRIIQESLTNVLKHAPAARHTRVRLTYSGADIEVEISNDDAGAPAPDEPGAGHGLVGCGSGRPSTGAGCAPAGRPTAGGGWRRCCTRTSRRARHDRHRAAGRRRAAAAQGFPDGPLGRAGPGGGR